MKKYFILITYLILLIGCASNSARNQAPQEEVFAYIEGNDIDIEIIYIGKTPTYQIFETIINNKTDDLINIDRHQFSMHLTHNGDILKPYDADELTNLLLTEKQNLKKTKKNRTILGAVVTGLSVLASASTGVPVAENLLFNSESVSYILEERRYIQRNIDSVDEEIDYIKSTQFNQEHIPSHKSISKDLLFPATKMKKDVEIIFNHQGHEYVLVFDSKELNR